VATAAGEDGNMVAAAVPLCFFIQTLVTLITAQNPGKCSTDADQKWPSIQNN